MFRTRRHLAIAWTLAAAQVVLTLLGAGTISVCRERDGSSHVKIVTEGCCRDGRAHRAVSDVADKIGCDEDSDASCGAGCSDSPILSDLTLAQIRRGRIAVQFTPAPGVPSVTPAVPAVPALGARGGVRSSATVCGPPRQLRSALRCTVLLI